MAAPSLQLTSFMSLVPLTAQHNSGTVSYISSTLSNDTIPGSTFLFSFLSIAFQENVIYVAQPAQDVPHKYLVVHILLLK